MGTAGELGKVGDLETGEGVFDRLSLNGDRCGTGGGDLVRRGVRGLSGDFWGVGGRDLSGVTSVLRAGRAGGGPRMPEGEFGVFKLS